MTFDQLVNMYLVESKKSGPPYIKTSKFGTYYYKDPKHTIQHRNEKDINGFLLPAVELTNGSKYWFIDDKQHRDEKDPVTGFSLPAVETSDGKKEWFINGMLHRDKKEKDKNGFSLPAVVWSNGTKEWWVNGELDRTDGPAIEHVDGAVEYWVKGKELTKEEFDEYRASLDVSKKVSETGNRIIPKRVLNDLFGV